MDGAPRISFRCRHIGDVNKLFGRDHAADRIFWAGTKRRSSSHFREGCRSIKRCSALQSVAVQQIDVPKRGVADTNAVLQHSRKHRLQIAGRTADYLEYFRGRSLLLQRLVQLAA
jgi:hypothetical protein